MASCDQNEPLQQSSSSHLGHQMDAMNLVQDLSTQLLSLVGSYEMIKYKPTVLVTHLYDRDETYYACKVRTLIYSAVSTGA